MDELFTIIGKLYFDLYRSQSVIDNLKKQLDALKNQNLVEDKEQ